MNLANKITLARLVLVPIFMLFASGPLFFAENSYYQSFGTFCIYIATGIFILAAAMDKLDGYIARKYNQVTRLGIFLDPLADKLLITAALICLLEMKRVAVWAVLLIIGRELVITIFRLSAVNRGLVLSADKSGKLKMVVQTIAIVAALLDNYPFSLFTTVRIDFFIMLLAVIITIYSGINYLINSRHVLAE